MSAADLHVGALFAYIVVSLYSLDVVLNGSSYSLFPAVFIELYQQGDDGGRRTYKISRAPVNDTAKCEFVRLVQFTTSLLEIMKF